MNYTILTPLSLLLLLCTTTTTTFVSTFEWSSGASGSFNSGAPPAAAAGNTGAGGGGGRPPTTPPPPLPCGTSPIAVDPDMVNSTTAELGQVVWQVSVMTKKMGAIWRHACGGAVIGKQAVLTAASCVEKLNAGLVRVEGAIVDVPKGGFVRRRRSMVYPGQLTPGLSYTEKIVKHPDYDKKTGANNLAVLRLATALDFAKAEGRLNTICYPTLAAVNRTLAYMEEPLFTAGWGAIPDKNGAIPALQPKLQLTKIDLTECAEDAAANVGVNDFCATQLQPSNTTAVVHCVGDIGSPVFTGNLHNDVGSTLIGITTGGTGCANGDALVYTNVQPYLEWIIDAAKPYY